MVDAVTGKILHRQNQAENHNDAFQFTGSVTATDCGPKHPFELADGKTRQIVAVANAAAPTDDLVVKIFSPSGELLVSGDLGTSPETATYSADAIPAGVYSMQVCPYDAPTVPVIVGPYAAFVTVTDAAPRPAAPRCRRRAGATSRPTPPSTSGPAPRRRTRSSAAGPGTRLHLAERPVPQRGRPRPWDTVGGTPTLTTVGNNANTHEAWASPLTPAAPRRRRSRPPATTPRSSRTPGTTQLRPHPADPGRERHQRLGRQPVRGPQPDARLQLLPRVHRGELQPAAGQRRQGGVGGDPEIGNAQAGALTGASPTYLGRDNANQITLQDGTPGITNQYLFQPIAGAFYAPCTDGGLDMGIVGHEYTHAISNRMVAGPDEGLTSEQGGAMGESWGDLVAGEYMFSHGYANGGNPWAVGVYATGNKSVAIRDYAINKNPLNYSDYGFDTTGAEVHADGEIWNGTQWSVRQALVKRWNSRYPYANRSTPAPVRPGQVSPAAGRPRGNRRWVQLMFDSFLLQQGATSMLDARDAMLAADRMRFGGKDLKVMWDAFASRGMGKGASTPTPTRVSPRRASSPHSPSATVRFRTPGPGELFVGQYQARATPVADTRKATRLDHVVSWPRAATGCCSRRQARLQRSP